MTAPDLLEVLAARGVVLVPAAEGLRYEAPAGALDLELLGAMRAFKPELARLVRVRRAHELLASRRRVSAAVDALGEVPSEAARASGKRWRDVAADYGAGRATLAALVAAEADVIAEWRKAQADPCAAMPCADCGRSGPGAYVVDSDGVTRCARCLTGGAA